MSTIGSSRHQILATVIVGAMSLPYSVQVFASGALRTVVLSDTAPPGTEESVTFGDFQADTIALNDVGQTAIVGIFSGPGIFTYNGFGVFSEGSGTGLQLIARAGETIPGATKGEMFREFFSSLLINNLGEVAIAAGFREPVLNGPQGRGIFSKRVGSGLETIALQDHSAPGTESGVFFRSVAHSLVMNDAGEKAFNSLLDGTGIDILPGNAIYREGAGNALLPVFRSGYAAPEIGSDVNFGALGEMMMNDLGDVAFEAYFSGPNVDLSNNRGIFVGRNINDLTLVARKGDPAPVSEAGVVFENLPEHSPGMNNERQIVFHSSLSGIGVDKTNDKALIRFSTENGLELVAREGDAAHGAGTGVLFGGIGREGLGFPGDPVINKEGKIAFLSLLTGIGVDDTNNTAIFVNGSGNITELVARTGDVVPQIGPNVTYKFLGSGGLAINARGQLAFGAWLEGPGIESSNDNAIFATNAVGELQVLVREGDVLDVSDDPLNSDFRTVAYLRQIVGGSGNEDGRKSMFNDMGQLAFSVSFTDGTVGVFVSDLVAVPEPTTTILALVSTLLIAFVRHRPTKLGK